MHVTNFIHISEQLQKLNYVKAAETQASHPKYVEHASLPSRVKNIIGQSIWLSIYLSIYIYTYLFKGHSGSNPKHRPRGPYRTVFRFSFEFQHCIVSHFHDHALRRTLPCHRQQDLSSQQRNAIGNGEEQALDTAQCNELIVENAM